MPSKDVYNLYEALKQKGNEDNEEDLLVIAEEFKRGHFPNVLSKSRDFRKKQIGSNDFVKILFMVEAVSYAQIGEHEASKDIITDMYKNVSDQTSDELNLLGSLAFMSDFKLARRIISQAIKQMEAEGETNTLKVARGYMVLGETEENLEKYVRAIKYYKQSLSIFKTKSTDTYMILFLHFKIGMLYSALNNVEESIHYLHKTIELTGDKNPEMELNSLVSIAKMYGSNNENESAFPYLEEALEKLPGSSMKDTWVHAEAMTEMAFYYFDQSKLSEAIPYYYDAIKIFKQLPQKSDRKLGMIHMQYAYCLEHKQDLDLLLAGKSYEQAIVHLEKIEDRQLKENAFADVITFFDNTKNTKKKQYYENKFVKMVNNA
ncbi:tetratricopeptide repeat protein [Virgibacillus byunsanensis]|uniref:Tetratricopeptide repeat protein n=1 Tax=Virgibacillus byunsanensis TaxID=570945 RepID=A0ABW3LQ23_9BACI